MAKSIGPDGNCEDGAIKLNTREPFATAAKQHRIVACVRMACVASFAMLFASGEAFAQSSKGMPDSGACGALTNAFGPFDYRADHFVSLPGGPASHAQKLSVVEVNHFTPEVEALIRGKSGYIGGDLDYTLRAFPNHPRALLAMMRYGERLKAPQVPGAHYTVECYFQRAIRFRADDVVVRMLYATFLNRENRKADALEQLAIARREAGDNPFTHYNVGLIYCDLGEYDLALDEAHKAMKLGFAKTELKDRLVAAQKWAEPAASAPE